MRQLALSERHVSPRLPWDRCRWRNYFFYFLMTCQFARLQFQIRFSQIWSLFGECKRSCWWYWGCKKNKQKNAAMATNRTSVHQQDVCWSKSSNTSPLTRLLSHLVTLFSMTVIPETQLELVKPFAPAQQGQKRRWTPSSRAYHKHLTMHVIPRPFVQPLHSRQSQCLSHSTLILSHLECG